MPNKTKNEIAWEKLEAKLHFINYIENNQQFIISADQIKNIGKREPRLMAKFDHHRNLPGIFKENKLGIVPVSGSEYYLSKFNPFKDLDYSEDLKYIDPGNIERYQTIELGNIRSEDKAIIIANISNILKEFTNEEDLRLTTKGKFGVGSFTFNLETAFGNKQVDVKGGGAELDAGFEGERFY
ncbi:transcriptional regulator, partial [Candidatus Dependentiae bacterium]|nr:transcriptional regulator [Candidatus Dependentiae bacterium]